MVILTEACKLAASVVLYLKEGNSARSWLQAFSAHRELFTLYTVPAGLYAAYNALTFYSLQAFDPTTYFILLQLRVILTAIIHQFMFNRSLSLPQYGSLLLLIAGCIVQRWKDIFNQDDLGADEGTGRASFSDYLVLLVQMLCSCFAGVYNEYLLKGDVREKAPMMIQNSFM